MSDFGDVQQFARQHAGCGGLTPSTQARPGSGGYLLTISCACGATHDRWVTAEEASQPLPRPSTETPPSPAPVPAPTRAAAWPARPAPPPPQRVEIVAPRRASRGRAVWLVLVLVAALGLAAAVYVSGVPPELAGLLGERPVTTPPPSTPAPAATPPAPVPTPPTPPAAAPRAALDDIVTSLRQLQADTTPSSALNDYAARVAVTRAAVERLAAGAPAPARARASEVLDVHALAVAAWRARTLEDRDEWERLGRDPAIDLCPAVKRAVEAAAPPAPAARARARGVAVGAALLPLWECAAEKVVALEKTPAGG